MRIYRATLVGTLLCTSAMSFADTVFASTFYSVSYPNPDPKFQKIGEYIYSKELGNVGIAELAEAHGIPSVGLGPYRITEIRMVQPADGGGALAIFASEPNASKPGMQLAEVSESTVLFNENGAVIRSWDFSELNIVIEPSNDDNWLVMKTPMSWYSGISNIDFHQFATGWFGAPPGDLGPAYEIRGVAVPAPATGLVMLGVSGLACLRRKR